MKYIQFLKKLIFITITILLFSLQINAQNTNIDSLSNVIKSTKDDSLKVITFMKLAESFLEVQDSANYYFEQIELLLDNNIKEFSYEFIFTVANTFNQYSQFVLAEKFFKIAILLAKEKSENNSFVQYTNSLGYLYRNTSQYEKSITILLENIKFIETHKIDELLSITYIYLAFSFRDYGDTDESLKYFEKSLENCLENNDSTYIHVNLHEIGNIYSIKKNYEKALEYQLEALEIRKKLEFSKDFYLMISYNDISIIYRNLLQHKKALEYQLKGYQKAIILNNYMVQTALMLNMGASFFDIQEYKKSEEKFYIGLLIAKKYQLLNLLSGAYNSLSLLYDSTKNYKLALRYKDSTFLIHDSIHGIESEKIIEELKTKYETEKKDEKIVKQELEIKRKKTIIFSIVVGFGLVCLLLILLYRQFSQKRKAFEKLELQNQEILQQRDEIVTQSENLEESFNKITVQKIDIEQKHKLISDSIVYASRIQTAILPERKIFYTHFKEHFIYYKPRDVVSGDFYWLKQVNDIIIFAVADCTGHGVPGAFVSMLGISLLDEINHRSEIINTSKALCLLRKRIKIALKQSGQTTVSNDGMDIALCAYDKKNKQLQFSGAKRPLFIYNTQTSKLDVYKGTTNPIGFYPKEIPFKQNNISNMEGSILYLFSDGFPDQFNENSNKFTIRKFKELILTIADKQCVEQRKIIDQTYNTWKGNAKQLDDILIVGLKI